MNEPAALNLTVPNETVERGIVMQVAEELGVDFTRISVIRVTRKKGGGVTADVAIAPEGSDSGR